jgi:hypothetical protein
MEAHRHATAAKVAAAAALAIAGAAVLYAFPPAETWWYPRCPFLLVTGLKCPGCGTLRALHAALHGRLAEAFRLNALAICVIPLLAFYGAAQLRPALRIRVPAAVWTAIAALVLLFGIARNV